MNKLPAAGAINTTFRASVPQVFVTVDRTAAKARGVNLTDLFATLQAFLSTLYINDFNLSGKTYRVQAQAQTQFRQTPSDIGRLYVRGSNSTMMPVSALTTTSFRSAPTVVPRFNGFTSAQFTGPPKPGHSSGELLSAGRRAHSKSVRVVGAGRVVLRTVVSGARVERRRGACLRARPHSRLPRARRAVRELVGAVRGAARRSVRRARRVARHLDSRSAERHLLPGRTDHRRRTRGEERHSHRGVREPSCAAKGCRFAKRPSKRRANDCVRSS